MCDLGRRMFLKAIRGPAVLDAFMYGGRTGVRPQRGAAYEPAMRSRRAGSLG
jgi:hypothetical protein